MGEAPNIVDDAQEAARRGGLRYVSDEKVRGLTVGESAVLALLEAGSAGSSGKG